MKHCDDCGCRVYNGACVNCHEVIYIEQQYEELDMEVPELITNEANQARQKIMIKESIAHKSDKKAGA